VADFGKAVTAELEIFRLGGEYDAVVKDQLPNSCKYIGDEQMSPAHD
jgi:hypothetical protein